MQRNNEKMYTPLFKNIVVNQTRKLISLGKKPVLRGGPFDL